MIFCVMTTRVAVIKLHNAIGRTLHEIRQSAQRCRVQKIFGNEEHKEILIAFLNAVLDLTEE